MFNTEERRYKRSGRVNCTLCRDTGWLLEAKNKNGFITIEILPCLIPDCEVSGKRIELISVYDLDMDGIAIHPKSGIVTSLFKK